MRKRFLATLAAATILLSGMLASRVAATPSVVEVARGMAAAPTAPIREAAIVCGGNGCAPAQTTAVRKRKLMPLGHG